MGGQCCRCCRCWNICWEKYCGCIDVDGVKVDEPVTEVTTGDTNIDASLIYKALFPYESRHDDELSFREGDLFHVITRDGDWWKVCKIDKDWSDLGSGFVPSNYLEKEEFVDPQP